ncbi:MAG TPA: mercury(II) reductase [Candidatus Paceibacterota bacterium]|nr:mercury(II) reductase [Candidatus Paceibacterota bacterium]
MNADRSSDAAQSVSPASGKTLVIIGGGSAAFSAALKAADLGARAVIINDGLPMGGTCVNVGCVPSKTLIRGAEALHRAAHPPAFAGIATSGRLVSFKEVIEQKRALVQELRQAKYADVISDNERITFVKGRARLLDNKTVATDSLKLKADAILIATGARPNVPTIPGLDSVSYLTNESAFELETLPESLLVLGGRYIALECAQMFARFGSRVAVLQRSDRILPDETPDLTEALTGFLRAEGMEMVTGVSTRRVTQDKEGIMVEADVHGQRRTFRATHLLVATGRTPNIENAGLETVGVKTTAHGAIEVDDLLQTSVPGIYATGDVIGENMFVYTAAYEGSLAAENALTGARRKRDYTALPWVIFTDPQVAGVGLDEKQAKAQGIDAQAATLPLTHVPRSLATRDTRGFIQLIRDRQTDRLVGARILAAEGSELLMEVSLAIKFGITVRELTACFHPYLTLGEGVKLAALAFDKDIGKLSCCAA